MKLRLIGLFSLMSNFSAVQAEPWIDTRDSWLRADIETLSDIGVITVPITTYPLMWAGIIKDIDNSDIENVPTEFKEAFWRVKKAGKAAITRTETRRTRVSHSNGIQVLRSFGDEARGQTEFSARQFNMSENLAWNIEVTKVLDPFDGDKTRYDGSYIALVSGNWVTSIGAVERWWGASWDSTNLVSNNARPPIGISVNRNYSESSDSVFLHWMGAWNFTGFVSQLENYSEFNTPYFSGISFSVKPVSAIELSFRATSLSGGDRPSEETNNASMVLRSFDARWRLPLAKIGVSHPTDLYFSVTDEDPNRSITTQLIGISSRLTIFNRPWRLFVESSNTGKYLINSAYEDNIYRQGYRYNKRAIGSTYDNDSEVLSLGLIGRLSRDHRVDIKVQNLQINRMNNGEPIEDNHTINKNYVDVFRLLVDWQYFANKHNKIGIELEYIDKTIDSFERNKNRYGAYLRWDYMY